MNESQLTQRKVIGNIDRVLQGKIQFFIFDRPIGSGINQVFN